MHPKTEVGWLRLGDLEAAAIPGEIYPELVLDKVQDPADPGADFPEAPIEPAIYKQMRGPHRILIGLANDEVGYIIPKRQWDEKPPFCYGRKKAQYGEENSVGPETAPILCRAFKELVAGKNSRPGRKRRHPIPRRAACSAASFANFDFGERFTISRSISPPNFFSARSFSAKWKPR